MAEQKPSGQPASPGKAGKLAFFALLAVNLIANGIGTLLVYKSTIGYQYPSVSEEQVESETTAHKDQNKSQPVLYTMDPLVVNLAGTPQRAIRMAVSLEMLDQDGFEEIMAMGSRSRDMIVRILNQKTFSDVETLQGKLFLKDQIALALNSSLKSGVVKDVYFTDFVVE